MTSVKLAVDAYLDAYMEHVRAFIPDLDPEVLTRIETIFTGTNWEEPQTSDDWNNVGVMTLIEALRSKEVSEASLLVEVAREAWEIGLTLPNAHPLCAAHLAMLSGMLGDLDAANRQAFQAWISTLHIAHAIAQPWEVGLVYLPGIQRTPLAANVLLVERGYQQACMLWNEVLLQSLLILYNPKGLRFLHLAQEFFPKSTDLYLRLGVYSLMQHHWEGMYYLHTAQKLAPAAPNTLQALYLAYRTVGDVRLAQQWLAIARAARPMDWAQFREWLWTGEAIADKHTVLSMKPDLMLFAEPSLNSIVTSILLVEGDWFECELDFWRRWLKPGMTVLDVGANVGIYSAIAARCVGASGRVIAVEPFSQCVERLQISLRDNGLDWVRIYAGAASDRAGTVRLGLRTDSECNALVGEDYDGDTEVVECFTLDELVERAALNDVHFIKVDVEGHGIEVFRGADRLLREFMPIVLYENTADAANSHIEMAEFLEARGYCLCRYIPLLEKLHAIASREELGALLNVIAVPRNRMDNCTT